MHHRQEENINYLFYLYTSVCLYVLSHDANGFPIVGHSKKKKSYGLLMLSFYLFKTMVTRR
jgi:hypothetical protein